MSKTGVIVAALFLAVAVFQGTRGLFASDGPSSTAAPTTSPEPTPSLTPSPDLKPFPAFKGRPPRPKTYGSTRELAADLKKQGIDCSELNYLDQPDPSLTEFSLCDPGAAERRFNIYFYEKEKHRAEWLASMKVQQLPLPLVWGPNWIVVASGEPATAAARIRSIQGAIGGSVEDFSAK